MAQIDANFSDVISLINESCSTVARNKVEKSLDLVGHS